MTQFRHLLTLSKNPCEPNLEWYERALKSWICPDCRTVRAKSPLLEVVLNDHPDNVPLNFVSAVGLGVISRSFIDQLDRTTFRQYFETGTLIGPDGNAVEDHYSFRGKQLVFIRGNANSSFRRCPNCDRFLYHPAGAEYVLEGDVIQDHWYESQMHQLLIPESKYKSLTFALPKTAKEKIKVQSQPNDGLDLRLS